MSAAAMHAGTPFGVMAQRLGLAKQPIPQDYGGNVVVQPNAVYVNGNPTGTPQQYSQQAQQIASAGQAAPPAEDASWMPLGVFAVVEQGQTNSNDIFQLSVNAQGIIRGNYHNTSTNEMVAMSGSVDKQTQRAAWTIGDDKTPVYEAGIANLSQDTAPLLVHTDDGVRQVSLIRVQQPQR